MRLTLDAALSLPSDGTKGTLIGRAWLPGPLSGGPAGPAVVALRADGVWDITGLAPTVSELLNAPNPLTLARATKGAKRIGTVAEVLANSPADKHDPGKPYFLAPCDLQAVKAAGVTFANSMLERVIESKAKGDATRQDALRRELNREIGADLSAVRPGSIEADKLKQALILRDLWSPYLEVGIGPYAEIFTKCPPMASVGTGAEIGLHPDSSWNNPEPEIVLAVNARGEVKGATLGNDVNLRDFEGRSALLLGKAKDNNASSAVGPFIRLFDETYSIDDVRRADVNLSVRGEDQFLLDAKSSMAKISRDPLELVAHTAGAAHQYPDGFVLFLGTMFAPTKDRGAKGSGFTHHPGDIVTIATPTLGSLVNRVTTSDKAPPWTFGSGALMRNLAQRGLL
ncbi:MAG: fumarylacetoacetate hydrolase family protein [Alphaproteobacteria bacterium]|nr:fumarylacetoacetate hydrolase family protein [Alphaproteobacteria bacterium]